MRPRDGTDRPAPPQPTIRSFSGAARAGGAEGGRHRQEADRGAWHEGRMEGLNDTENRHRAQGEPRGPGARAL
ncbi:hypothetical protein [Streptomyces sp. NPDC051001]|uniref:hypothetical protein n=1 Tax=Streptomyces sp. NPDC051001 TaxID=3155795 RepID=UPI003428993D